MVDASTLTELQAEIARLRAVCDEFDVDPDWAPEPPLYWVPTAGEMTARNVWDRSNKTVGALIDVTLLAHSKNMMESITRMNPLLQRLINGGGSANG